MVSLSRFVVTVSSISYRSGRAIGHNRARSMSVEAPRIHQGAIEFRRSSEEYYHPSVFTSNSSGYMGQARLPGLDWQSFFVNVGPQARSESSVLPTVQQYFPPSCVQQLLAEDLSTGKLFFRRHRGESLSEVRFDFKTNSLLSGNMDPMRLVNWAKIITLDFGFVRQTCCTPSFLTNTVT